MKRFGVILSVTLAMVFWGITFVIFKFANESFDPIAIIFFRLLISIPFLFGFAFLSRRMMKVQRKDVKWFLLMAFFEPFLYFLGESFGLSMVSSTLAAIIISTIPLFVPIAAYFIYKEILSVTNIIGLLISFAGVVMVVMTTDGRLSGNVNGILLMLLAVFGAIGYTLIAKKLVHIYNGIVITAWQSTLGAIYMLPLFLIFEAGNLEWSQVKPSSLYALLYLGIFGSGICFILFTFAIRELGASKANVFANLVPVVTAITAFFVLDEAMPALKILGIIVVLAGLMLTQMTSPRGTNGKMKWRKWFTMPRV